MSFFLLMVDCAICFLSQKMSCLFWDAARPLLWVVCCVTDLRSRACTLLCLLDQMSCRKQSASVWDKHENDICEPVQAEPLGKLL